MPNTNSGPHGQPSSIKPDIARRSSVALRTTGLLGSLIAALSLSCCSKMFDTKRQAVEEQQESTVGSNAPDKKRPKAAPKTSADVPLRSANLPSLRPTPAPEEFARASEVMVKGSTALGCETKMVRDWLRIWCHGKNDTGGAPIVVTVLRGAGPDVHASFTQGEATLLLPYVEGVAVVAVFSWTDRSHRMTLKWPRGSPKPLVLGAFEGAASPLNSLATKTADQVAMRLCECRNQVQAGSCLQPEVGNPFCHQTYGSDCRALVECWFGDPGRVPTCPAGQRRWAMNQCVRECDSSGRCPEGTVCEQGVCLEN